MPMPAAYTAPVHLLTKELPVKKSTLQIRPVVGALLVGFAGIAALSSAWACTRLVYLGANGQVVTARRSEEHTSELQSQSNLVCRLLLEKKKYRSENALSFN